MAIPWFCIVVRTRWPTTFTDLIPIKQEALERRPCRKTGHLRIWTLRMGRPYIEKHNAEKKCANEY
jgi:hypothetical protein